ncbi:MAG: SH3 domain-containing protein [Alicyclobacillaceae bacterium]|nr:SH3 domain-containing protein [Alicyclobacillaceae bacterium]
MTPIHPFRVALLIGAVGAVFVPHSGAHAQAPSYAVYQYKNRLQDFNRLEDAVAYARLWDHSRVVNLADGSSVWDNYPTPMPDLGYWILRGDLRVRPAWTREEAIAGAQTIPGSRVVNALTGQEVWRNPNTGTPSGPTAAPPNSPNGTSPAVPNRIPDRPAPYGPDYYRVEKGTLLHVLGSPGSPPRATIVVGPAPAFLQEGAVYVRDGAHRFYLRDTTGDRFVGTYIPPYENLDLRTAAPVSAEDIDRFIRANQPDSPLVGLGKVFIEAQNRYGVNAQYLAAHAILESGWGWSSIALDKHNLFGYQAYDWDPYNSAAAFASYEDCIRFIAYFVRTQYLDPEGRWYGGSPTLLGMNVHYATDPDWAEKIASIMERMRPYRGEDYRSKSPLPVTAPAPPGPLPSTPTPVRTDNPPVASSPLPPGTAGRTTDAVHLRTGPSTAYRSTGVVPPNSPVTVLEKSSNGWYKVIYQDRTGWMFGAYVRLDGLLMSRVDDWLNVRSGPGTSFQILTRIPDRTYLVPVTTPEGTPIIVNNWYHVQLPDGTKGWVFGQYVVPAS